MKKKLSLVVLMMSLAGCGNNGTDIASAVSGGSPAMLARTTVAATTLAAVSSNQFLATSYQDGQAEIQMAQLALQKSTNGKVKNFAQRMIDHHTAANNGIAQLAQLRNIALPTDLSAGQKEDLNRLSALPVEEFDNAYLQANVSTHERDVVAFKDQAANGNDADIRQLAGLAHPILKAHLAVAQDILSALNPYAFLVIAYQSGLAEIQLSQLALQKTQDGAVRDFAQRMIDEHTQANNRIASVAQQKNVSLPGALSPSHQETAEDIARFSGADFDRTYMDVNVIEHAKAVRLFRKQSRDGRDEDVKNLARSTLPALAGHLTMALQIDRDVKPSFLYSAYQSGKAEVGLSYLALLRSSSEPVRTFAQRMISEHNTVNAQIVQLAQQKNTPLPTEIAPEHMLAVAILGSLSREDFDDAFLRYNARLHDEAIEDFTAESAQGTDPDLRTFAQNTLPALTQHRALAGQTRDQLGAQSQ